MITAFALASAILASDPTWFPIAASDDRNTVYEAMPSSIEVTGTISTNGSVHMLLRQTTVTERTFKFLRWSVPISVCITGYGASSYHFVNDPESAARSLPYVKGGGTVASIISEQLCEALLSSVRKSQGSKNNL
jgi:hypothetical protein